MTSTTPAVAPEGASGFFDRPLADADPDLAAAIRDELDRQQK